MSECDDSASSAKARSRVDWNRAAGTLLETAIDDARERRRNVPLGGGQVRRIFFEDRRHRVDRRLAAERALARQHLVEHGAEREDVRAMIGRPAAHLLGRHVADRAEHHARRRSSACRCVAMLLAPADGRVGLRELRETEVENLHAAVVRDEDVLRLQIAMDDALLVRGGEAVRDLHRVSFDEALRTRRSRPAVAAQPLAQRLALEQLRDDVRRAVVRADVVDREDVRMIQRRGRARLLLEARQTLGIGGERGGSTLMATSRPRRGIARAIDLAHPARPEQREDFVGAEAITCGEWHL